MATTQISPDLSIVTTEHPSATRLRQGFEAFGRGDLDTVRGLLAEDCSWTNAGSSILAGTYQGWDAIQDMFLALFEATGGTHAMQLVHVLGTDACSVAVYDATSTIAGATRTMRFVMVQQLDAEGRAREVQTIAYDQAAADAHMAGIPQQT